MIYGFDNNKHKVDITPKNIFYTISSSATNLNEDIPVWHIGEPTFNKWTLVGARYYGRKEINGEDVVVKKDFNPLWYYKEDKTVLHIECSSLDTSDIGLLIGYEVVLTRIDDV